jgi:exodeoxyribonuclease VII small subunit
MSKGIHFEQSMTELEDIVKQLEKGELTLEDSLKQFEKGISLARRCQDVLNQAGEKIELLTATYATPEPKSDEQEND